MARKRCLVSDTDLKRFLTAVKAAGFKVFGIELDAVAGKVRVTTSEQAGELSAEEALKEWEERRARPS
jgi:hypothetical protein